MPPSNTKRTSLPKEAPSTKVNKKKSPSTPGKSGQVKTTDKAETRTPATNFNAAVFPSLANAQNKAALSTPVIRHVDARFKGAVVCGAQLLGPGKPRCRRWKRRGVAAHHATSCDVARSTALRTRSDFFLGDEGSPAGGGSSMATDLLNEDYGRPSSDKGHNHHGKGKRRFSKDHNKHKNGAAPYEHGSGNPSPSHKHLQGTAVASVPAIQEPSIEAEFNPFVIRTCWSGMTSIPWIPLTLEGPRITFYCR
ncbi:hypothetical protein MTO96_000354 [Rhipicephalus appendiculatus]